MPGEFEKRIKMLGLDGDSEKKVLAVVKEVGSEYSCLLCSSKDTCENFKWYLKWFNE